ncbi:hypothetical protein [Hoeflea sp.]|uniref:hypothetical protein n=1 Tax=Hoeflea sp. TaxID=1940281 RepID=UPI0019BDD98C|nr:hypothetical protein [Hoeflea sp.]MBC7280511.1 DUF1413 domain-containing protein [Hoeflea sp.]
MSGFESKDLTKAIETRKPGPFYLSDLCGADRDDMQIADRVKACNVFLRHVGEGRYPMAEDTGQKDKHGHICVRRA